MSFSPHKISTQPQRFECWIAQLRRFDALWSDALRRDALHNCDNCTKSKSENEKNTYLKRKLIFAWKESFAEGNLDTITSSACLMVLHCRVNTSKMISLSNQPLCAPLSLWPDERLEMLNSKEHFSPPTCLRPRKIARAISWSMQLSQFADR